MSHERYEGHFKRNRYLFQLLVSSMEGQELRTVTQKYVRQGENILIQCEAVRWTWHDFRRRLKSAFQIFGFPQNALRFQYQLTFLGCRKIMRGRGKYIGKAKGIDRIVYKWFTFGTGVLYLIQINHQPDANIFQLIILTFVYSSTCFGRFHAHHQELNDCSGSLWFYLRIVVTAVLCSWSGRSAGPTTNTALLPPRYEGKTRGCHCSHWAPDDGRENARNMLSCKQTSG
jgi:hypothetical protein